MVVVRCIGDEVDFSKELLLVVLKFAHHLAGLSRFAGIYNLFLFF